MLMPGLHLVLHGSRRPKPLLEKLELLVDRLLGRFHLDEAVDQALAVGLDPLFEVGDLDVNFARLLSQGILLGDDCPVVANHLLEIRVELCRDPLVRVVEEGLELAQVIGDGVIQRGFVIERQLVAVAIGVDADLGQRIESAGQSRSLVVGDGS